MGDIAGDARADGSNEAETRAAVTWVVRCKDADGRDDNLVVSVDESHRIVLRNPTGESATLTWSEAQTLSTHLIAAATAVLRGGQV